MEQYYEIMTNGRQFNTFTEALGYCHKNNLSFNYIEAKQRKVK